LSQIKFVLTTEYVYMLSCKTLPISKVLFTLCQAERW